MESDFVAFSLALAVEEEAATELSLAPATSVPASPSRHAEALDVLRSTDEFRMSN
jgi:hypothetical protein